MPAFQVPQRPVQTRRGTARLRFTCFDPDGCRAAAFTLRRPTRGRARGFTVPVEVPATALDSRVVAVRLDCAVRRILKRSGHRGAKVTLAAAGGTPTPLTLVARR